ncbi:efflux RND transporter periplasmic adaptor subunit [Candidatus Sumerlaeota bacterium]|nr:efflux RND transporter periplasmic adaptor subunit [Candidatus Sumerlaeota bacterium]
MKATLGAAGILTAAILTLFIVRHGSARSGGGSPASGAPAQPVAVITVQPERVTLTTELPGRTSAYLVAEVRPQVNGLIQQRLFTEGADVEAGQTLYQIDPAHLRAAYSNAEANLTGAQKAVDRAQAALETSRARVAQQEAVLTLARTNRKRLEELAGEGAVSISERDKAVTEAEVAAATLQAAKAQIESDKAAIALAKAAIQQAEAALESARINLEYTKITAPISGCIGKSNVTVGALATAYQPLALTTIQQLDPIYVDVTQSTNDMLRLRRRLAEGQLTREKTNVDQVRLFLDDGSEYPLEGALQFYDVTVDPSTGSVIVRIVFPNPDRLLLPGMFVRAILNEGVNEKAILIPQQAVSRNAKGDPMAMIVNTEGKVELRMLELDRAINDKWLVASGLKAGDQVIVEGLQKVRPGSPVTATPFASGATPSTATAQ